MPMTIDDGIYCQQVQAYFQFVQDNLIYMNDENTDLFQRETEGEPKAMPAALPKAHFVKPSTKPPAPKGGPKEHPFHVPPLGAAKAADGGEGEGAAPKSRGKETYPKNAPERSMQGQLKLEQAKFESGTCERCFAKAFRGQVVECDICGLVLETTTASRTKIADRRKDRLSELGFKYDFRGDFPKEITDDQLRNLGVIDDQARGSISPEADIVHRARQRVERAKGLGFHSVLDRFTYDPEFAETVLNEGENEHDCERYDLLCFAHLPKPDRTRAQVKLGVSESSQKEHAAMRLVYLDFDHIGMLPDRFRYIGQRWLYMYKTQIYSEGEYVDYLGHHPEHNLLLTNLGIIGVDVNNAQRHLNGIKNTNEKIFEENIRKKIEQSERAKAKKRKAEAAAQGQAPVAKRCIAKPVAPTTTGASSSSSISTGRAWLDSPRPDVERHKTWEWWQGKWYQKVYRNGRVEWEPWLSRYAPDW
jgi:hypothetical protein